MQTIKYSKELKPRVIDENTIQKVVSITGVKRTQLINWLKTKECNYITAAYWLLLRLHY